MIANLAYLILALCAASALFAWINLQARGSQSMKLGTFVALLLALACLVWALARLVMLVLL